MTKFYPTSTYELPHIAWLGESDFELRGRDGYFAIWSEKAQKGVDYNPRFPLTLDELAQLQKALRYAVADHLREVEALDQFFDAQMEKFYPKDTE